MSKIRVYELAKELNVSSKDLINLLMEEFGVEVKNHMSVIEDEDATLIKELLGDTSNGDSEGKKSLVDEYEEELAESLNKGVKKKKKTKKELEQEEVERNAEAACGVIEIGETITVKELCEKLGKPTNDVIKNLIFLGVMAGVNQEIDFATAEKLCEKYEVIAERKEEETELEAFEEDTDVVEENLVKRPPIVTIMGHVDHGKTSLLDAIRHAKVTASEAGGITQHIGASEVSINGQKIVFLDTPGHEAFTSMRARGAQVTDIAILVVAADDGIMPQTIEAINHANAAGVPLIVAINKIDKPGANPDKVKKELADEGLLVEDWGGSVISVEVSAKKNENIDTLLEMVLLVAEMEELRANPNKRAVGTVIEAQLDKARGPVATVLVQGGTLKVGDPIVAGVAAGKVRAMINAKGKRVKQAGPSTAVEILGLSEVPQGGDQFVAVPTDKIARSVSEKRQLIQREEMLKSSQRMSLDDLFNQMNEGQVKDLNVVIKADVQGSVQAVKQSLEKLSTEEVNVRVIHGGVGAINESDVLLAAASNAIIIGFNVRPVSGAESLADKEGVDIRTYTIIYKAIEDIQAAMSGLLDPELRDEDTGKAEIREVYKISGVGAVAGCYVTSGKIYRNCKVRIVRDGIIIQECELLALKRFKDDVKEVNSGYECGMSFVNYNDIKVGDIVEAYVQKEVKREL